MSGYIFCSYNDDRIHILTAIEKTQRIHLHPRAAPRNPPASGPTSRPVEYRARANPRFSCRMVSAMILLPLMRETEAKQPCTRRNQINAAMDGAMAHAIEKARNPTFPACCTTSGRTAPIEARQADR